MHFLFYYPQGLNMLKKITEIKEKFESDLKGIANSEMLEELRIKYLGRKGLVSQTFAMLSEVPADQKRDFGKNLNLLKNEIEQRYQDLENKLKQGSKKAQKLDLTLPGRRLFNGKMHPLNQVANEIKSFFTSRGFVVEDGPEIETDYYNFEALNFPKSHPARDMQDTLFVTEEVVLRTHTSPVQIRVMERQQPPIRMIAPGRVYRRDTPDASHSPFFHQVEGLYIDKNVSFVDLKQTLLFFAKEFFGAKTKIRLRPSFFPFTERMVPTT